MTAQTRSEITGLLAQHGLTPSSHLGQHFLADANITRKIVEVSGVGQGSSVVEVGAGTGTLTAALAAAGARVVAFEVDRRLEPVLEVTTAGLDVTFHFDDAMSADLPGLLGPGPWVLVANLPYNVGTPLLLDLLRGAPEIVRFVVMVQREVAERLVAAPGTAAYGLPSVVVALHGRGRLVFRVPPQVFVPPPRVESAVVVIDRVPAPPAAGRAVELASAAFGQRRKMLRKSLQSIVDDPVTLLEAAGIDPTRRAEELSAEDYLRMASA